MIKPSSSRISHRPFRHSDSVRSYSDGPICCDRCSGVAALPVIRQMRPCRREEPLTSCPEGFSENRFAATPLRSFFASPEG
jgi:hypothetical protein